MTGPIHGTLSDVASNFVILPNSIANALDVYGPDALAWVWIVDGKVVRFRVEAAGGMT